MMRILIADDEALVRIGLKSLLEGCSPLYEIIEAEDGCEALRAFADHSPSLVFADINMPGMDGLQFVTEAKKLNRDCKFIVLTCHSDFERMREAIKIGLDDYIIKTEVRGEELVSIVRQKEKELGSRAPAGANREENPGASESLFVNEFSEAMKYRRFDKAVLQGFLEERSIGKRFNLLMVLLKGFVNADEQTDRAIRNIITGLMSEYGCGYSFKYTGREFIIIASQPAGDDSNHSLSGFCDRLVACLRNYLNIEVSIGIITGVDIDTIVKASGCIEAMFRRGSVEAGYYFCNNGFSPAGGPEPGGAPPCGHDGYHAEIVGKAKAFMQQNLDKKISLMEVAAHVNVSPCHFSKVFKAATGSNFIDYSMKLRIEKVKSLIGEGLKITAAAESIGYCNYSYFSKLFKKIEGVTPEEYKRAVKA